MKAVVFHDVGDIRLDQVPDPGLEQASDALVRITHSAICGTDLHMVRGTLPGMAPGTVLGHEAVGVVEEAGKAVRNLARGDRVVIPSTIACGHCVYCRGGYYAQCDEANPNGPLAGTAFFGGPQAAGGFDGLQAEYARVPFAATNLVKLPEEVDDEDALLVSDMAPTGYFGADLAGIKDGHTVAVLGCGAVGLFAIKSAQLMNASRVLAIDNRPSRLTRARALGAETIDFDAEDPVAAVRELTGGVGVDAIVDAVGVDAEAPRAGPAAVDADQAERFARESREAAPVTKPNGELWQPGGAPSQALEWAVQALAKGGTLAIIGVYPPTQRAFPIGAAMQRNLTVRMGNCNHRRYLPALVDKLRTGALQPRRVISQDQELPNVIDAYQRFDRRESGWVKVALRMN